MLLAYVCCNMLLKCWSHAGRCIWTSFCDVISIRRLASQSKKTFNLMMMKWTFWFCWKLLFIDVMDWSVLLINLCLFAIQNCFLTFIKVPVDRTWLMLMDWLRHKRCAKRMPSVHFSRTMACMTWKNWFIWLTVGHFLLAGLLDRPFKKAPIYRKTKTVDLVWGKIRRLDYCST